MTTSTTWHPVFSSHGIDGRKTHLGVNGGQAICGAQAQYSHLLWEHGCDRPLLSLGPYLEVDADGVVCARCARQARALIEGG